MVCGESIMDYELTQTPAQSTVSLGQHAHPQDQDARKVPIIQPNPEQQEPPSADDDNCTYLTGLKLSAVVSSTTLVVFLILLDVSIISTVSR